MDHIAVGGFQHETNTFAPSKADFEAFARGDKWPALTRGDALFEAVAGINIPIAALATFVSNPLTMAPMYFFAYQFGAWLIGIEAENVEMEMSFDWVAHTFVNIWQPMLLGCVILGSAASLLSYIILDLLWRSSLGSYKARKRRERNRKA